MGKVLCWLGLHKWHCRGHTATWELWTCDRLCGQTKKPTYKGY